MHQVTLCFPIKDGKILLGLKKRGVGTGKLNGFGGKIEEGETAEFAAIRELREECDIHAKSVRKVGELTFLDPAWPGFVHVFLTDSWDGLPKETDEMKPEWFSVSDIPYDKMWDADKVWLPLVLSGKYVKGSFVYGKDKKLVKQSIDAA